MKKPRARFFLFTSKAGVRRTACVAGKFVSETLPTVHVMSLETDKKVKEPRASYQHWGMVADPHYFGKLDPADPDPR
jgi:hypothetical protein